VGSVTIIRVVGAGGAEGCWGVLWQLQILTYLLTLSQPGGHIMPTTLLLASPPRISDLPTALNHFITFMDMISISLAAIRMTTLEDDVPIWEMAILPTLKYTFGVSGWKVLLNSIQRAFINYISHCFAQL
jgi:hypothetical protein